MTLRESASQSEMSGDDQAGGGEKKKKATISLLPKFLLPSSHRHPMNSALSSHTAGGGFGCFRHEKDSRHIHSTLEKTLPSWLGQQLAFARYHSSPTGK